MTSLLDLKEKLRNFFNYSVPQKMAQVASNPRLNRTATSISNIPSKLDYSLNNQQARQQFAKRIQEPVYGAIDRLPTINMPYQKNIPKLNLTKPILNMGASMFLGERGKVAPPTPSIDRSLPPREALIKFRDDTAKQGMEMGLGIAGVAPTAIKERGLVTSVKESQNIFNKTKAKVAGMYKPKANTKLMGEANALLTEGASIDFKNVKGLDKKVTATIQQAINLDKAGYHQEAANLFNNLSEHGTELGRGVQAFSMIDKMSPEAISLSVAGKINRYNMTATRKIPPLTGEQQKMISDSVARIDSLSGREKNIAINNLTTMINEFIPSSITDKIITTWKAGLLTSLRTHERNLLGNTIMGTAEVGKDIAASPADWLMSKKTGERTLTFTTKGMGTGAKKGWGAAKDVIKYGYDPEDVISKYDVHHVTWDKNKVEQALKKYTDSVFRTLGAEDKVFYNSAFGRSLYDQAGAQAINVGKQGNKVFIENLVKNPTEQMLTTATKDASTAVFRDQNKLTGLANSIKQWAGKNWYTKLPVEVMAPFTGVPSSIVGKTVAYSPIGLIKGSIDTGRVMLGKTPMPELQRQAAQEVGRGVMGTALFAIGAYLMSKGLMTGQPKDAKEARAWQLQNKPSNSIFINGKWRSINSIGPQNLVVLAGAKYQEEMNNPEGSAGAYGLKLAKDQLSQTFLSGVQQPLQAITDPARYGKSYTGNLASSVIPNIVKDASKSLDPYARETNKIGDYMKLGTPIARNTLLPKRDALGNIVPQEPTGISSFVDVFNSKTPISNIVVDEIARLNAAPGTLDKSQTIRGTKRKLTPEELNTLEAAISPELTGQLERLFKSTGYNKLSDEDKINAIESVVTAARKKVRGTIDLSQSTPSPTVKEVNAAETTSTLGQYILVNPETGSVKNIDLSAPIGKPETTGIETVDKILLSSYKSELNSRIKDVIALYQDKQIPMEQMAKLVDDLQAKYDATKIKKPKKVSIKMLKSPSLKVTIPKRKSFKIKKPKKITPKYKKITLKY